MSIYTKTGDKGETSIYGGKRVPKFDPQVEACGAVDEASSFIGLALTSIQQERSRKLLSDVQYHLYLIMAYLAGAEFKEKEVADSIPLFEKEIDTIDAKLPKLTRFILPQGSEATSRLHVARAMIRSAERRIVYYVSAKGEKANESDGLIVKYLNRLSDLLFMLAREFSEEEKVT